MFHSGEYPDYPDHFMVVHAENVTQLCKSDGKVDCILLISIDLLPDMINQEEVIPNGRFSIIATQERRRVGENSVMTGYLLKEELGLFYFENIVENATIVIEVDNNNEMCLDLFIIQGTLDNGNYSNATYYSNSLIVRDAAKSTYSISFLANEDCHYSFQISTT